MIAIIKRELRALIFSWRSYAFIAIFAVCSCALRLMYNYMSLYDVIYGFINHEYILTFLPAALALAVPVITFSAYENERKNEVFSFLRSLPVKATEFTTLPVNDSFKPRTGTVVKASFISSSPRFKLPARRIFIALVSIGAITAAVAILYWYLKSYLIVRFLLMMNLF